MRRIVPISAVSFLCLLPLAGLVAGPHVPWLQPATVVVLGAAAAVAFFRARAAEGELARQREADGRRRDDHLRIEDDLRRSEERFRLAASAVEGIIYDVDPKARTAVRTLGLSSVLGYDTTTAPQTMEWWGELVHPDDAERVRESLLAAAARGDAVHACEYRVRHRDGHWVTVMDRARIVRGENGETVRVVGCTQDVTERRAAEARFRLLADAMPQIVYVSDPDGRPVFLNRRWAEYVGEETPSLETPNDRIHPDDRAAAYARWQEAVAAGTDYAAEMRLRGADGRYRWFLSRCVPVRDAAGRVEQWFGTSTDVHDRLSQALRAAIVAEAAEVLLSADDPSAMLRKLFDKLAPVLELDVYVNYMLDDDGTALRLDSFTGIDADSITRLARLPLGEAICGRAAELREPILAVGLDRDVSERTALARSLGLKVYACNPLLAGDRLIGTLSFASRSRDSFDAAEWEFLRTLCRHVAFAYERLRLLGELRLADRRKDEFLATLAHELRNPLAPIRNGLQILRLAGNNAAAAEQARAMMDRQLSQMVRLVDDLLDVSRITRNKLELRRGRTDLRDVLRGAVETARPLADAAGHELTVAVADGPIPIDGDFVRLAQVFANLLNNAAKYTPPGGRIRLAARADGGAATVTVSDNGVGIPPEQLRRVFDMFAQVDTSLDRSQGGLGIGLTLVRRLVELHGGAVAAHSDGSGRGCTVTVTLPLPPADEPARRRLDP